MVIYGPKPGQIKGMFMKFSYHTCFHHKLLLKSLIDVIWLAMIYIFPKLSIDIMVNHICGHMLLGIDTHFQRLVMMAIMAQSNIVMNMTKLVGD